MTLHHVCKLNVEALIELETLLKRLPEQYYTAPLSKACAPVGTHVRHVIEFYRVFLQGLELGLINYDDRQRCIALETKPAEALEQIAMICRHLTLLDSQYNALQILACGGHNSVISTSSNIQRELLFLQNHTAHHKAIIGLLLEQTNVHLPEEFGMAISTRVQQQKERALPD